MTRVDIPNGMHTEYAYDASGRQDAIHHKDGTTVVQGFDYTFDDGGNITRLDHEDGSYWAYDYNGRDRLIEAERYDSTSALPHRYTYTYDDGDNMLTKAVYDPSGPTTVTTSYTYNDATDHLGSSRSTWNASKASVGAYEFTPYGGEYQHTGAALASLAGAYTGKPWDDTAQLFHFPYRQYSPDMARWTSRDPLGMVDGPNVYGYVGGRSAFSDWPPGEKLQTYSSVGGPAG